MFNSDDKTKSVSAVLTLSDGRKLKGTIIMSINSDLMRLLNSDASFIEFETHSGARSIISSSAIVEVSPIEIPKVRQLKSDFADDTFDPYKILGLTQAASAEEIKAAYFSLTKLYHPDRYTSMDLPSEMLDYINAMSRRINSAHTMIGTGSVTEVA